MLDFISKEPIYNGWSCDKKYCVTTAHGTKYLLRVTPFEKSANRENMYLMQKEVEKLCVPMCKPIDFGKCDEGVYTLQTWIDGKDAEDVVPYLSDSEQYAFGIEVGRILKKIHTIPAPDDQLDWEERFNKKMDRYDFGDPWEEFNRIVWCAQSAPIFASGIVNGYFDDEVQMAMWKFKNEKNQQKKRFLEKILVCSFIYAKKPCLA